MTTKTTVQERLVDPTPAEEEEALQRVSQGRTTVAAFTPFFGHLVLKMHPVVARAIHRVDTAAIAPDGTLYVNHVFLRGLTNAEVAGLMVHEVLHPALLCWARQGTRRAMLTGPGGITFSLWNLAHDLSFNPDIVELSQKCKARGKIKLPKDAALDAKFLKQSCEQIYDALLKEAKKNKQKSRGGTGQGSGGCQPGGLDGILTKIPGSSSGAHGIGDDLRTDLSRTNTGKRAAHGDEGAQKRLEREWKQSVIAAAIAHERSKGKGSLPGNLQKLVEEFGENKVDWTETMSQFIGEHGDLKDISMRRPSRRSESAGVYLAGRDSFGYESVIVFWDTSGSMNGREKDILAEVQSICEDLGLILRVICIDVRIHSDTYGIESAIDLIPHIKGGGGSNFCPAFTRIEEEGYEGIILAFTDGHIDVPDSKPPHVKEVLWVIEPTGQGFGDMDPTRGSWGQVLLME